METVNAVTPEIQEPENKIPDVIILEEKSYVRSRIMGGITSFLNLNEKIEAIQKLHRIRFKDEDIKNLIKGSFSALKFVQGYFTNLTPKVAEIERDELRYTLEQSIHKLKFEITQYSRPDLVMVEKGKIVPVANLEEIIYRESTMLCKSDEMKSRYLKAKEVAADILRITEELGANSIFDVFKIDDIYKEVEINPEWFAE